MQSFQRSFGNYALLESNFEATDIHIKTREEYLRPKWKISLFLLLLTAAVCFALSFAYSLLPVLGIPYFQFHSEVSCKIPSIRREWRTLNSIEKKDYIRSVWCFKTIPSRLGANQTLYDDFPLIHAIVGGYCEHYLFYQLVQC